MSLTAATGAFVQRTLAARSSNETDVPPPHTEQLPNAVHSLHIGLASADCVLCRRVQAWRSDVPCIMQYSPCRSPRDSARPGQYRRRTSPHQLLRRFTYRSLAYTQYRERRTPGLSLAALAADGGHGSGNDGNTGAPRRPTGFDSQGPKPGGGRLPLTWLKLLGIAAGGYVVLAILEPWSYLNPPTPIDTFHDSVAIIIPALNESTCILDTLHKLHQLTPPVHEVIVVDGGSTDDTVKLVKRSRLATKVLTAPRGRASQMNAGAEVATADMLCFLHADSLPPIDLVTIMRRELSDPRTVLAGLAPSIEVSGHKMRGVSLHNWLKTYYAPAIFRPVSFLRGLRVLFGDQAMFCRTSDFLAVGGYDPTLSIMEDADLCLRLHHAGHSNKPPGTRSTMASPYVSREPQEVPLHKQLLQPRGRVKQVLDRQCVTSGRRIAEWGSWRATYIQAVIGVKWYFGQNPDQLRKLYHEMYTDNFR